MFFKQPFHVIGHLIVSVFSWEQFFTLYCLAKKISFLLQLKNKTNGCKFVNFEIIGK